jgi:predicted transcriptional regulator
MKRTTISLPDDMAKALDREARRRGTSVSAIAREALADRLRLRAGEARELPFVGLGRSGTHDTARRAEEVLAEEWDADRGR